MVRIRVLELALYGAVLSGAALLTFELTQLGVSRSSSTAPDELADASVVAAGSVPSDHTNNIAGSEGSTGEALEPTPETAVHAPRADEWTEPTQAELSLDAQANVAYPIYARVLTSAVNIRQIPRTDSKRIGMLRAGTTVRLSESKPGGDGCRYSWYSMYPQGWVCLSDAAIERSTQGFPELPGDFPTPRLELHQDLPLEYLRVTQNMVPAFHELVSHRVQAQADTAGEAWRTVHGSRPMPMYGEERPADVPTQVAEYLNAGYWISTNVELTHHRRKMVRTNRGTYIRKYQTESREVPTFQGVVLPDSADALPQYWILRSLPVFRREGESLVETGESFERRSRHPFVQKQRIGDYDYYEDAEGRLMRAYGVGLAERTARPPGVGKTERWIHVDLSEQTLVAYDGDRPVYTTVVSSGKEEGMTPEGVFRVQSKHLVTPMKDAPMDDDAYSIEDVPWTQFFDNEVALHGAFWHNAFGLVRSHGCVNLSPADARWLFGFTAPQVPHGWLAAMADTADFGRGSPIVITK